MVKRLALLLCLFSAPAEAQTITFSLAPAEALEAGKTTQVVGTLLRDGKPLTFADLKEVHTRKLHLLVIDPSLTDYQHIHPLPGKKPGEYVFDFTPKLAAHYRAWADITPLSGAHAYVRADMGAPLPAAAHVDKLQSYEASQDGLQLKLSFDMPPQAGKAAMGQVVITKDGKPFTQLEPVMGAFAHIVAFSEDYQDILHVHPMGKEPQAPEERGGSVLEFHIEPKVSGFIKLFVQLRIDGKDVFVPFGVDVK